ncbi:MAG: CehA/McbA family metallohydrolase [Christensenellaceae bacterium]|jgi:hypothetical protein|nr:CehA/McbA family metallohydrolase [Christensenellaceae bacterium]
MIFYPFELHTHTIHSDGSYEPEKMVELAKRAGLFGVAITDHNTVSGNRDAMEAGQRLGVLVIPGIEWTTFYGHLTVLGGSAGNWRDVNPQNVLKKVKEARLSGACVGVAHPCRPGYPICTGGYDCWGLKPKDYAIFTHYEAWSYLSPALKITNDHASDKYLEICRAGVKIACAYGRDWHKGVHQECNAVTYLGIDGDPNIRSSLNAIIKGHTYISTGIRLEAWLNSAKGVYYDIGATPNDGEYEFAGMVARSADKVSQKYAVKPQVVELSGTAGTYRCEVNGFKHFSMTVKASKGEFLQPRIYGEISGRNALLLQGTPFFFK